MQQGDYWPVALIGIASLAYYLEYALNFIFVGYVNSVTFSVSDIARRVAIIMTGAVVFQKPLTATNWLGITIALGGVLWYSFIEGQVNAKNQAQVPAQAQGRAIAKETNTDRK